MTATRKPPAETRTIVHASNAWNPTGRNLLPVPRCRLYYAHADVLGEPRTLVFLGTQQHLVFAADIEGHRPVESLRDELIATTRVYPHQVDLDPAPGLPRIFADQAAG